jgi:hypothetical protein
MRETLVSSRVIRTRRKCFHAQADGNVPGAYDDNTGSITATLVIDYLEPSP